MTKKIDQDNIVALEKAIAKKYGDKTVQNPKANWDDIKEKEYIEQLKKVAEKLNLSSETGDKVEFNGVFVSKKLLNREIADRTCSLCERFSFNQKDDLYMTKFNSCFECYIKHIEGRETKRNKE
jgi:hypothetical protein